jgi:hypothetical protein
MYLQINKISNIILSLKQKTVFLRVKNFFILLEIELLKCILLDSDFFITLEHFSLKYQRLRDVFKEFYKFTQKFELLSLL